MSTNRHHSLIRHQDDIGAYVPPGHRDTVNVRLVDGEFCGRFEMNLGTVQPGGEAEPHLHETEHQPGFLTNFRREGAKMPRQDCNSGPHGPKDTEGVADPSLRASPSKWLSGVRPATASRLASAAGSW